MKEPMKNEKDCYVAVLKSKIAKKCNTLDEIKSIDPEDLQCILYAHYCYTYQFDKERHTKETDWYRYEFVNQDGEHTCYRSGDFEIRYIGEDEKGMTNWFEGRTIEIANYRTGDHYSYHSAKLAVEDFVFLEIIPLLDQLNGNSGDCTLVISSFESYDKVVEEREQLRQEVNSLRKVIAEIKELCMPIDLSNL